jgi:hypothetical protein
VWYKVLGNGELTTFLLFAEFDSRISIYKGEGCEKLECLNTNDDSPIQGGPSSSLTQTLEDGSMYFISVHGYGVAYGNFSISSQVVELAANNDCIAAQPLELGVNISGDTSAATGDPKLPECGV